MGKRESVCGGVRALAWSLGRFWRRGEKWVEGNWGLRCRAGDVHRETSLRLGARARGGKGQPMGLPL